MKSLKNHISESFNPVNEAKLTLKVGDHFQVHSNGGIYADSALNPKQKQGITLHKGDTFTVKELRKDGIAYCIVDTGQDEIEALIRTVDITSDYITKV